MGLGCQESPHQTNPTDLYTVPTSFSQPFSRNWFWNCPRFCPQIAPKTRQIWYFLVRVGTARNTGIWDTKKIQHLGWTVGAWNHVVLSSGCRISHSMTRVCHSMRLGAQTTTAFYFCRPNGKEPFEWLRSYSDLKDFICCDKSAGG